VTDERCRCEPATPPTLAAPLPPYLPPSHSASNTTLPQPHPQALAAYQRALDLLPHDQAIIKTMRNLEAAARPANQLPHPPDVNFDGSVPPGWGGGGGPVYQLGLEASDELTFGGGDDSDDGSVPGVVCLGAGCPLTDESFEGFEGLEDGVVPNRSHIWVSLRGCDYNDYPTTGADHARGADSSDVIGRRGQSFLFQLRGDLPGGGGFSRKGLVAGVVKLYQHMHKVVAFPSESAALYGAMGKFLNGSVFGSVRYHPDQDLFDVYMMEPLTPGRKGLF